MKYRVHLTASERQALKQFVACGKKQARHITRARILLLVDEGKKNHEIAELLSVSRPTICSMRKKYAQQAYDHIVDILPDAPRPGERSDLLGEVGHLVNTTLGKSKHQICGS